MRYGERLMLFVMGIGFFVFPLFGQRNTGTLTGRVVASGTGAPIEYANIVLLTERQVQVTGTTTDREGGFRIQNIRPGRYVLEVRFMGFKTKTIPGVEILAGKMGDVGTVALEQEVLLLEGVGVEGEKPAMTYEIDKKVIHVDQVETAVSGTALEVLENVPSVTVDIDGNVSLRGSTNFQLLIDGRPTVLEPSQALQQIPASTIETIEIITNPSVKYNPEGTAGIINLILKKNQGGSTSGLLNLDGGLRNKYGGNLLLERKTGPLGLLFGVDFRNFHFGGSRRTENWTRHQGMTTTILSTGENNRGQRFMGLRGGLQYGPSQKDLLTLETRIGGGSFGGDSEQDFTQWSDVDPTLRRYASLNEEKRSNTFIGVNLSYQHRFDRKGHELNAYLSFRGRDGKEKNADALFDALGVRTEGRRATEEGPSHGLQAKLEYALPLGEAKLETGFEGNYDRSQDLTRLETYDPTWLRYEDQPQYAHDSRYASDIHALYLQYGGNLGPFGYQAGLRGEYTGRVVDMRDRGHKVTIDRWDYFPTAHLSYQLAGGGHKQLMASYTRRINRPRGWDLEPFYTWMDAYNVRMGNPGLLPEFIDAYEAGFQTNVGKNMFSAEAYYRVSHNRIERVQSVYAENIRLHTVANVGNDYAFGGEVMLNMDLARWWNINLMGNVSHYRIDGVLFGTPFTRTSFNWTSRLNQLFRLGPSTQIQVNGRYNSPTVSPQGRREGFYVTDVAFKQEFFGKTLSLTLQVRDLFRTGKFEFVSEGPDFYSYGRFRREAPEVLLNIRLSLNRFQAERRENGREREEPEREAGDIDF